MIDIRYTDKFTYGELARVLISFGLAERTGKTNLGIPYRAFSRESPDVIVMLPNVADSNKLEPIHLRRALRALEDAGIADTSAFFQKLRQEEARDVKAA